MNWGAIGAIGEVVGGVAVLITLAYLAIQIRITNRLLLIQHRETNRAAQFDLDRHEIEDRGFGELLIRAEADFDSLDEVDDRRVRKHVRNELIHRQNMFIRGTLLGDPRAQRIALIGSAEILSRLPFALEMIKNEGWDESFKEAVLKLKEVDP